MLPEKIVLVGFMGCGKSSVGKALAKVLGYEYIDSDFLIEKQSGRSINKIFKEDGETSFRNMESDFLKKLSLTDEKIILSTGGGMPCFNDNAELIKKLGLSVYLSASPSVIYERIKKDTSRPLLQCDDKLGRITGMLSQREEFYKKAADVTVVTDGKSIKKIVDEIIGLNIN